MSRAAAATVKLRRWEIVGTMWRESWATFSSGKTIGNASYTDTLGEAGEEASVSLAVAKPAK